MWNNAVSYLHAGLQMAFQPLAAMAHEYPTTTLGIAVLFALLAVMLVAEIVDGRATAARIAEAPRVRLKR